MTKYLDLTPPPRVPYSLKVIVGILACFAVLLFAVTFAFSAEVPLDATLLQTVPLPCVGGQVSLYDTDRDPSNGAEFVTVEADGRRVAILQFSPGHNGGFVAAVVQIPNQPEQVFASAGALSARYSHPCEIVQAAGVRT